MEKVNDGERREWGEHNGYRQVDRGEKGGPTLFKNIALI